MRRALDSPAAMIRIFRISPKDKASRAMRIATSGNAPQ
jgi:hypothetical protein